MKWIAHNYRINGSQYVCEQFGVHDAISARNFREKLMADVAKAIAQYPGRAVLSNALEYVKTLNDDNPCNTMKTLIAAQILVEKKYLSLDIFPEKNPAQHPEVRKEAAAFFPEVQKIIGEETRTEKFSDTTVWIGEKIATI